MPDDFQDLEAELKSLRPRAVAPLVIARIEQALAQEAAVHTRSVSLTTIWRSWKWVVWPAVAAGVALLALVVLRPGRTASSPAATPPVAATLSADVYKPIRADNVLYGTHEEGRVTLPDGSPARRIRSQYVDTITWKNPKTNASLSWSVPREEVRVVPVSFQ